MPNTFFRHILALALISVAVLITGCDTDTGVNYTPPFGFVSLRVGTNGISIQSSSPELETPIGTFTVDTSTSLSDATNQQTADNGLLLTIRYNKQGTLVDEVYQINTGGSKVVVTTDGHITITIEDQRVFIDASKGNIQTIEINNSDSSSSTADTSATDNSTPIPPPTATPEQQAQAAITTYYTAINNKDYQTAYNLWVNYSDTYQDFANGFATTQHDDYQFGQILQQSDGTVTVNITLTATSTSGQQTNYQGYYNVGQQSDGSWKFVTAFMSQV